VGDTLEPHRRGTSPRLDAAKQTQIVQDLRHGTNMNPRDRAAGILVLVITLGTVEIALTQPLDEPWRELAASPTHDQTAAHPNSSWVFRGGSPGRHLLASTLTHRLSAAFSSRAARLGTLHELSKLAPVAHPRRSSRLLPGHDRTPCHRFIRQLRPIHRLDSAGKDPSLDKDPSAALSS
jgi:hypothetical protein